MPESRLPGTISGSMWRSLRRMPIGSCATRLRSGSASRRTRYVRNAALHNVITTSFVETPKCARTACTSCRATEPRANARRAVSRPLNGLEGASNGRSVALRPPESANRTSFGVASSASTPKRAARTGVVATATAASAIAVHRLASSPTTSCARSGRSSGASGVRSKMTEANAAPWSPSMHAWCTFSSRARRPARRPSMRQSSQSGRDRSSGRPKISPTVRLTSRSPPGGSTVACLRCASGSMACVSSQTGQARPPARSTRRRRNGARCRRRPVTRVRTRSGASDVAASTESNIASAPTCMCHSGVSAATRPASVRLSGCTARF